LLMRYVDSNFKQGLLSRQTEIDRALADWLKNDTAGRSPKQAKKAPTKPITSEDRIVSVLNATAGFIKLSALRPKLGLVFDRHIQLPEFTETTLDLFREIMSQAKATVSTWGGKLYFVYLPSWERYGDPDRASVDRDQVLLMVKTLDVPIIDLHPVFQAHPDPVGLYPFRRWGHYNKEGHKVVAEAVLRFIASTN
jgi:hypothetical protein